MVGDLVGQFCHSRRRYWSRQRLDGRTPGGGCLISALRVSVGCRASCSSFLVRAGWENPGEPRPLPLEQVPPADFDIPILGQLASAQLALGDALEPGPLEVIRLHAPLRGGRSGSRRWDTRRGTRTMPWYSPISTPNSTACCSAFQWASSGRRRTSGLVRKLGSEVTLFFKRSRSAAQQGRFGRLGHRLSAAMLG